MSKALDVRLGTLSFTVTVPDNAEYAEVCEILRKHKGIIKRHIDAWRNDTIIHQLSVKMPKASEDEIREELVEQFILMTAGPFNLVQ